MAEILTQRNPRSFAFGPFVVVPERQLLLRGQSPVRIGGRALDILTTLVERPGQLVSKSELMARVWPNTYVDEGNLKVNVAALRKTLGDGGPDASGYIATVIGHGYRFIAPVAISAAVDSTSIRAAPPMQRHPATDSMVLPWPLQALRRVSMHSLSVVC